MGEGLSLAGTQKSRSWLVESVKIGEGRWLSNLWFLINRYSQDEYTNLIKLAHLALTCPVHTSGSERGFSIQNSILTSTRYRLTPYTQNMLIRAKAAGKPQSVFDFDAPLHFYKTCKKRKSFSGKSDWDYTGGLIYLSYRNDPKFSDRHAWANSADSDQTVWSRSTLFAIPSASFELITLL